MFKIDIHTHILPPEIPSFKEKFGYGGFIQLKHNHAHGLSCGPGCGADMLMIQENFLEKLNQIAIKKLTA
jgi:hypothetical protein